MTFSHRNKRSAQHVELESSTLKDANTVLQTAGGVPVTSNTYGDWNFTIPITNTASNTGIGGGWTTITTNWTLPPNRTQILPASI